VADVTDADRRAAGFGAIGAAFAFGFIAGPALGGLLGAVDLRLPFWVAAGLCLANALYGILVLPESLPKDRRTPFSWRRANPVAALRLLRSNAEVSRVAAVLFLSNLAHEVFPAVFVLYTGHRYGWDQVTIGLALADCWRRVGRGAGRPRAPYRAAPGRAADDGGGPRCGAFGSLLFGLAPSGAWIWLAIPCGRALGTVRPRRARAS
jgi:DHA1 family tetracycline resistance protein-like MFS transporter